MGVHALVVLGFVDVEMNDVGLLGVLVDFAGNSVVEARSGESRRSLSQTAQFPATVPCIPYQ